MESDNSQLADKNQDSQNSIKLLQVELHRGKHFSQHASAEDLLKEMKYDRATFSRVTTKLSRWSYLKAFLHSASCLDRTLRRWWCALNRWQIIKSSPPSESFRLKSSMEPPLTLHAQRHSTAERGEDSTRDFLKDKVSYKESKHTLRASYARQIVMSRNIQASVWKHSMWPIFLQSMQLQV